MCPWHLIYLTYRLIAGTPRVINLTKNQNRHHRRLYSRLDYYSQKMGFDTGLTGKT
jgi:hypothetical protein